MPVGPAICKCSCARGTCGNVSYHHYRAFLSAALGLIPRSLDTLYALLPPPPPPTLDPIITPRLNEVVFRKRKNDSRSFASYFARNREGIYGADGVKERKKFSTTLSWNDVIKGGGIICPVESFLLPPSLPPSPPSLAVFGHANFIPPCQ